MSDENLNQNCLYTFRNVGEEQNFRKHVKELPSTAPNGAKEPIEYSIFRTGRFKHPLYGDDLNFDQDYLESLVENFRAGVVPESLILNVGHKSDNADIGAVGHIDNLKLEGGKIDTPFGEKERLFLNAKIILNRKGIELYKDRRYLFSSSEIHPDYTTREKFDISDEIDEDGGDGEEGDNFATVSHGPTLTGLAATNKPFINNLGKTVETDRDFSLSNEMQSAKEPQVFSKPVVESDDGKSKAYGSDTLLFSYPDNKKLKNNLDDDNNVRENDVDNNKNNFSQPVDRVEEEEVEEENSEAESEELEKESEENLDFNKESNSNEEINIMELSELLDELEGMDLSEQVDKLETKVNQFSDDEKALLERMLSEKQERLRAEKARKEAVSKQERYKQQKEELENENIELKNNLTQAKEGTKSAKIEKFATELEDDGYTQATVDTVKDILMSLPADDFEETYELTFSGPEGEEEKELSVKGMFEKVFSTMEGGPVSESVDLEEDPESTVSEDEKQVDPDEGAEDFSEPEEEDSGEFEYDADSDIPKKVQKFAHKYNYVPEKEDWKNINEDGEHELLA